MCKVYTLLKISEHKQCFQSQNLTDFGSHAKSDYILAWLLLK